MIEPLWIDEPEVLVIHDRQIDEHGGAAGLRDGGALASALARARQIFVYGAPDPFDLAAAYAGGIVRNHPFVDGNKRTAFVVAVLFLELNGWSFGGDEAEATRAVIDLAAGTLDETVFARWLRDNSRAVNE